MKTLVKTIKTENGALYSISAGNRCLLSECDVKIEVINDSTFIPTLGKTGCNVKKTYIQIIICNNHNYTKHVDCETLKEISRFEITADIQRSDGVFERFVFDNISPTDIDLNGKWVFEICGNIDRLKEVNDYGKR